MDSYDAFGMVGSLIADTYKVVGICSTVGGMGSILHVQPLKFRADRDLVLKYCKAFEEEQKNRFRREVRLLLQFVDNPRIVTIVDSNLEHDPPYFVMPLYKSGDLSKVAGEIRRDLAYQEKMFISAIDAVSELHARGVCHRDLKPQNFLLDGDSLVVSDLGLSTEAGSDTVFTKSSVFWGTQGFLPPEFIEKGGFRDASVVGDVYMLGKTFYALLADRDPTYLIKGAIDDPIFYVIEKACDLNPDKRFANLADLKQRLVSAYDVVLNRLDSYGAAQQFMQRIREDVSKNQRFDVVEARLFVERLIECKEYERDILCKDLAIEDCQIISFEQLSDLHEKVLSVYWEMVERQAYSWSFAEAIADNMGVFFFAPSVSDKNKTLSLRIAIYAARSQNRFAAMNKCREMLTSPMSDSLGFLVVDLVNEERSSFVGAIPFAEFSNGIVKDAMKNIAN